MGLLRFARNVVTGFVEEKPTTLDNVHNEEATRLLLERERIRADRTNQPLALLAYGLDDIDPNEIPTLARVLRDRLRILDDVGWLDSSTLCAILPGTDWAGARAVAQSIYEMLPADATNPSCSIYMYPQTEPIPQTGVAFEAPKPDAPERLAPLMVRPYPLWKRAMDLLGAGFGLVVLSPVFLFVAALVKMTSNGPILFSQERRGEGGSRFVMYKFRTMSIDAEAKKEELLDKSEQDGPAFKLTNDPRVTWLGKFLRKTSLDELPQLWNILQGHMALVGPRPLPCAESDKCEPWQQRRLDTRPGLTCVWQVKGRSSVKFADWMRMDLQYVDSQSLPEDLKLLALTVPAVLSRKGAH